MPRSNRYILPGYLYHVTHRCHDRKFLLDAAVDRTEYRRRLGAALERFDVSLLSYAITSNHTHEILTSQHPQQISRMMQALEGKFAEYYNARKRRSGAFWEDRYHSTMIEDGSHLLNCMVYIDLNMVRAGVVDHPEKWEWCGYHEQVGNRKRFRIIDHDLLRQLLGPLAEEFSRSYAAEVEAAIAAGRLSRESWWTEGVAVGSREYVMRIEELTRKRKKRIRSEDIGSGMWCVREEPVAYGNSILETL
jgi:putative transposase